MAVRKNGYTTKLVAELKNSRLASTFFNRHRSLKKCQILQVAEAVSASTKGSGQEHNNSESTDTVQGQEFC